MNIEIHAKHSSILPKQLPGSYCLFIHLFTYLKTLSHWPTYGYERWNGNDV